MKLFLIFLVSVVLPSGTSFVVPSSQQKHAFLTPKHSSQQQKKPVPLSLVILKSEKEDEDNKKKENPYSDPNYPELEFIDYSDPNYVVDQGVVDNEFFPSNNADNDDDAAVQAEIESMREERRRKNDEFQFETYFKDILKQGQEYKGEWTIYKTSTFNEGDPEATAATMPRFTKSAKPLKVISRGYKIQIDTDSDWRVDGERICHEERVVNDDNDEDDSAPPPEVVQEMLGKTYWPEQLSADDFRGHQGIMCVANAYTICTSVPLQKQMEVAANFDGPFAQYRSEIGIGSDDLRFRIKLDYCVMDSDKEDFLLDDSPPPPLRLKSMTVCRETLGMWPREGTFRSDPLFAGLGADGGLYDPPPVGSDEQAGRYMLLDLDGSASVLFPCSMDQDPNAFDGYGWVMSLDWTPGRMRYQVDRKVRGGKELLGLRTLELSEVQSADAATYRPKDGGMNMRQ